MTSNNYIQELKDNDEQFLASWLELEKVARRRDELSETFPGEPALLPTLPNQAARVKDMLKDQASWGLLVIDVPIDEVAEEALGWKAFDQITATVAGELQAVKRARLRKEDLPVQVVKSGSSFAVILSSPRKKAKLEPADLEQVAQRVKFAMSPAPAAPPSLPSGKKLECYIGYSLFRPQPRMSFERLFSQAVGEAQKDCRHQQLLQHQKETGLLESLLLQQGFVTVFQPVVDLLSLEAVGYSALVKTPEGQLQTFEHILGLLKKDRLLAEFHRTYLKGALHNVARIKNSLLFASVNPALLSEQDLRRIANVALQPTPGRFPQNIVFELSEQIMVNDFELFRLFASYLKGLGYGISLSHATLSAPSLDIINQDILNYITIDKRTVGNIDKDEARGEIVSALVKFARRGNCKVIAEGIEKKGELDYLRKRGVSWGWGTLIPEDSSKICFTALPSTCGVGPCL